MKHKRAKDGKLLRGGSARTNFGIIRNPFERDTLMGEGSLAFPSARSAEEVGEVVSLPESSSLLNSVLGVNWF